MDLHINLDVNVIYAIAVITLSATIFYGVWKLS